MQLAFLVEPYGLETVRNIEIVTVVDFLAFLFFAFPYVKFRDTRHFLHPMVIDGACSIFGQRYIPR
jgi:hypothetical protein